jgi:hypothetical protein
MGRSQEISRSSWSTDALERHQELLGKLERFEKYLMNQKDPGQKQFCCFRWRSETG